MTKPYDTRLIMLVAQQPFETVDMNQFCKLVPVCFVDGTRPMAGDFPNDGEIWWMLTSQTARLANPGQMIVGVIENAIRYDQADPNASEYQVKRESVQELGPKDGMEVIDLRGDAIEDIQDLVSGDFRLDIPIRPAPSVFLRWRAHVYGPFISSLNSQNASGMRSGFSFTPSNATEMTVYQIAESTFDAATRADRIPVTANVSVTTHRRSENYQLAVVTHDLMLASGYERILATNPSKLILEPVDRKLMRFAKECRFTRAKRQHLRQLLEELELTGRETSGENDLLEAVGRIKQVTESQDVALNTVANAMLKSGLLGEDRIRKAEQALAENFVQQSTAELQAKAEENLAEKRNELRIVEARLKDVRANFQKEETMLRAKLDNELAAEREKSQQAMSAEREVFQRQKSELERQQTLLERNLEKVTKDLRDAGDDVVNRFLTIAPLLGSLGLANGQPSRIEHPVTVNSDARPGPMAFEIPSFAPVAEEANSDPLDETAFFDRFRRVVEESGFMYRLIDLQRFHLSVKCGELTVLGGPSGTGKSSLPALYAQSLLGEGAGNDRAGCLMVNINPSWMDIRDLVGHMNTLEGRFYPGESGLFHHLVYAFEEYKARGAATGIWIACLDEMNLSQVEHYFSDLMMALEREGKSRFIQCFSADSASDDCPFRAWGRVVLSPALRFVGTVNFDETTRLLSDRFLDRANLIRLTSATLPAAVATTGSFAKASGRIVTLADFDIWRKDAALPTELASLLDQMRPLLNQIGCPVSPRVYRAICRFVGSATAVLPPSSAFDIQVAQRIVPKIRSLVTRRQLDALDQFLKLLKGSTICSFDEAVPLLEEIRESAGTRGWDLEE